MDVISAARRSAVAGHLPAAAAVHLATEAGIDLATLMLALIPVASELARPHLSGYKVGAIAEGASGDLYFGANLEMPVGPLAFTIHGEQAVIINAMKHGETGLSRLAISAAPCGVCRQFLYELASAQTLQILLSNAPPIQLAETLPGAFGPSDLGLEGGLMGTASQIVLAAGPGADRLTILACKAATHSYAPYTGSIAGVAVRLSDATEYSGFAIENAAFTPSLFPLQVALSSLAMANRAPQEITEAVQVELSGSPVCYREITELQLKQIAPECVFSSHTLTHSC